MNRRTPRSTLFSYTTLFRSIRRARRRPGRRSGGGRERVGVRARRRLAGEGRRVVSMAVARDGVRSEEHTSELQSQFHIVCRLLLEKKNIECYFMTSEVQ